MQQLYAPVAQLDRVSDSDSEGRAFESHQAYQLTLHAPKAGACFFIESHIACGGSPLGLQQAYQLTFTLQKQERAFL